MSQFHSDIDRVTNNFLSYEPYRSRAGQISFHYVDNTSSLGCSYSGRLLMCNPSLVTQAVNNAGAPYDKIITLVNNGTYGGSGYLNGVLAVAYNGYYGPDVAVHESAHTMSLLDEYTLYASAGTSNNTTQANCYAGAPPDADWAGLVATYTYGCNYPNWYRSSPSSLMYAIDARYFNAVSQRLISQKIDYFTQVPVATPTLTRTPTPTPQPTIISAPTPTRTPTVVPPTPTPTPIPSVDTTAPSTRIVSPGDGSTVSGTATITVEATDAVGVSRVELWKDNQFLISLYNSPYTYSWATTSESNGIHTLQAKAYDVAGNQGVSTATRVTVNNLIADMTAPLVALTAPTGGTVSGVVQLAATALDDSGTVSKVEFYLDGQLLTTKPVAPYQVLWDTTGVVTGTHTLYARAYDASNNIASSSQVTVAVDNISDTAGPVITVLSPTANQTVSGSTFMVRATASDQHGVGQITITLDGRLAKTCNNTTNCSYKWDLRKAGAGGHSIKFTARDKNIPVNQAELAISVIKQ